MNSLHDRMKLYESVTDLRLVPRTPAILRVDGRGFSKFTRAFNKPFDDNILYAMQYVAQRISKEFQGVVFAYGQSDEISFMLIDYKNHESQMVFGGGVSKICSVAAGLASAVFNKGLFKLTNNLFEAHFDARVFSIPESDVPNYFYWRNKDCVRNSVSMVAQQHFSHSQLQGKNRDEMIEMLHSVGVNWGEFDDDFREGWIFSNGKFQKVTDIKTQSVMVLPGRDTMDATASD